MQKDIRTMQENGKTYAILPIEDYEKLLAKAEETASDEELYHLAKTRGEEPFPIELFDRMDAGKNPIKIFREYRKLSVSELAKKAKLSQPYLSQLEKGSRQGSPATIKRLAGVLHVPMETLLES